MRGILKIDNNHHVIILMVMLVLLLLLFLFPPYTGIDIRKGDNLKIDLGNNSIFKQPEYELNNFIKNQSFDYAEINTKKMILQAVCIILTGSISFISLYILHQKKNNRRYKHLDWFMESKAKTGRAFLSWANENKIDFDEAAFALKDFYRLKKIFSN